MAPCCLRWAPCTGRMKTVCGDAHRPERGQAEGQLDRGKEAAVRVCTPMLVHWRGEEGSGVQRQEKGQAERRPPL